MKAFGWQGAGEVAGLLTIHFHGTISLYKSLHYNFLSSFYVVFINTTPSIKYRL